METKEIVAAAREIAQTFRGVDYPVGPAAAARDFLRVHAGPSSRFFQDATEQTNPTRVGEILAAFAISVDAGIFGVNPKREAQIEVVSDFLEQAQRLLEDNRVHPAAPAVLVGAALEEFLRNWTEAEGLTVAAGNIENYSKALREHGLLAKQDGKDITSWAGIRNHAAHGEWNDVPRAAVLIMLHGVNLFMRTHQPSLP